MILAILFILQDPHRIEGRRFAGEGLAQHRLSGDLFRLVKSSDKPTQCGKAAVIDKGLGSIGNVKNIKCHALLLIKAYRHQWCPATLACNTSHKLEVITAMIRELEWARFTRDLAHFLITSRD